VALLGLPDLPAAKDVTLRWGTGTSDGEVIARGAAGLYGLATGIGNSSSSAAGDVGDGTAVGTGISVGDDGAFRPVLVSSFDGCGGFDGGGVGSRSSSSSPAGDVGDGTAVGTGISVGDDGASRARVEAAPEEDNGILSTGISGISRGDCGDSSLVTGLTFTGSGAASSSDGTCEVGDGIAVGTGISVGEEGCVSESCAPEPEPDRATGTGMSLGLASVVDDRAGPRVLYGVANDCDTGARRATGGGTSSSMPTGDVGDGTAVGTGSSVGDGTLALVDVDVTVGFGGAGKSSPSSTGEVGDGTAVGTGNSVGDVGAVLPGLGGTCLGRVGTGSSVGDAGTTTDFRPTGGGTSSTERAGEVGDGTAVGTGISVGDDGAGKTVARGGAGRGRAGATGTGASSSLSTCDVGDGTAVGTGISVGDDGAGTRLRRAPGAAGGGGGGGGGSSGEPGVVGAGASVGIGISVGEASAGRGRDCD